jgi:acyl-CoA thioesterase
MAWDSRDITAWGEVTEHRRVWMREDRPFVEGEALSPFLRAALASDAGNGQLNSSPTGLGYINADVTMTLARLPEGDWIGLDARSRVAADGVAVGSLDLYDAKGRIGQVALVALGDERNLPLDGGTVPAGP